MAAVCAYTLQWDAPFLSSKLSLPMGGPENPSKTWFLGPTRVLNPNGILIGSAVFAGLTSVTDRSTDQATRLAIIGRTYICSIAMQFNNNNGQQS